MESEALCCGRLSANYSLHILIFNNPQFSKLLNTSRTFYSLRTLEKASKNAPTEGSNLVESFFDWMKYWVDI